MTNLALALQETPEIAGLVRDVVIMGGAFHVEGNATPAAEANIFGDPDAADIVFGARLPATAIPLNMTRQTLMTREQLAELGAQGGAAAQMVADLSQGYIDFYGSRGMAGMVVHDCCAAVYLTDPDLFDCRSGVVRVVSGSIASGMTIQRLDTGVSPPGEWGGRPSQRVCYGGQAQTILERIHQTCSGKG
jgi:purine nucleosidase